MHAQADESLLFGPFRLDERSFELFKDGAPVPLPVQSAKILAILAGRSGDLVTREEIHSAVWSDRYVDVDAGLNSEIKKIRQALGDNAADPAYIETVPRRGYRFVAPVTDTAATIKPRSRAPALIFSVLFMAMVLWRVLMPYFETAGPATAPEQAPGFASPAYDAHLKGRVALSDRKFDRAAQLFSEAIAADSGFAPAYTGLARTHIARRYEGWQRIEQALGLAETAIALDPSLQEASAIKAGILLYYFRAPDRSGGVLEPLLAASDSSADLYVTDAFRRMILGDAAGAIASAQKAYAIDPVSPTLNANYGWIFYKARRYEEAERLCKTSVDLAPSSAFALECVIYVNHSQRDFAEAADYGMRLMAVRGASPEAVAGVRSIEDAVAREQAYWRWTLGWLASNADTSLDAWSATGIAHTMLGERDQAVAAFEAAFNKRSEAFPAFMAVDPRVDGLRLHPAFARLVTRSLTPVAR